MVDFIRPTPIDYSGSQDVARALQSRAAGAGATAQALGGAIGKPLVALGAQYTAAQEQQAAQQAAEQKQALALQAMQGVPGAQEQLFATDPAMALQMAQVGKVQAEQAQVQAGVSQEQEDRERREVGRLGNAMSTAVGDDKRRVARRFYDYISTIEDGNPAVFGMDSREAVDTMSVKQLNRVAEMAQSLAKTTVEQEKSEVAQAKLGLEEREVTLKEQAAAQPPKEDLTSLQKNLVAAGIKPGSPEFREAVLSGIKSGTVVNIGKQSEGQRKDEFMAATTNSALSEIKESLGTGEFNPTGIMTRITDKFGTVGNFAKSPEWQIFEGANDAVIEAYLNKTTGAAYNELQLNNARKYLKISAGDTPKTVKTKLKRIENLADKLNRSAGLPEEGRQPEEAAPAEERTVTETRTLPDGRTIVRYSDGTLGVQ